MKIGKIKRGELVVVHWMDANSPTHNTWISEIDLMADTPKMSVESSGFFCGIHKKHVRLAADRSKSKVWVNMFARTFNIPVISITKIEKR